MTQFKDKGQGQESVSAGLFDYPVLMAADILLYDTDEVPVGDDQRQHVELARDIAIRFNHRFGDTLVVPKATIPPVGARIKDLQRPEAKMSKSTDSPQGTILVLDSPAAITKKVKSAVTDSGAEVRFDPDEKPGVSNLLALYASATGTTVEQAEAEFAGAVRHVQGRGRRRARRVPPAGAGALRGARGRSRRGRAHPRERCGEGRGDRDRDDGPGPPRDRTCSSPER